MTTSTLTLGKPPESHDAQVNASNQTQPTCAQSLAECLPGPGLGGRPHTQTWHVPAGFSVDPCTGPDPLGAWCGVPEDCGHFLFLTRGYPVVARNTPNGLRKPRRPLPPRSYL